MKNQIVVGILLLFSLQLFSHEKVILDTDSSFDPDDVGCIAMLQTMASKGECKSLSENRVCTWKTDINSGQDPIQKNRKKPNRSLRIITHNVWYGFTKSSGRKKDWIEWMKLRDPDIVSLQELNEYTEEKLADDAASYGHSYSALLKEGGFPTGITSRYPIKDIKRITEGFHHGLLRVKIEGIYIYVIHLHPSNWQIRKSEIRQILEDVVKLPSASKVLLAGDFNTFSPLDSTYYSHGRLVPFFDQRDSLYGEKNLNSSKLDYSVIQDVMDAGLTDLEAGKRPASFSFPGSFPTLVEKEGEHGDQRRLDYIFASQNLVKQVSSANIIANDTTLLLSDHLPLVVELELDLKNREEGQIKRTDPSLNQAENQHLDKQAQALLNEVNTTLSLKPPAWPEPPGRRSALLLLDAVLHDVYAPHRAAVQDFFQSRITNAIKEIEASELSEGLRIWKLYNHSFVVQTASLTMGFDLVRGESVGLEGFRIQKEEMSRLIDLCDVLFISHYHSDHAEEWVAQTFIDQGKPVLAPADVFENQSLYAQITHLDRIAHKYHLVPVQGGRQNLKVVVYPGHQSLDINNNVYLVTTPEGLSLAHLGDQSNDADFQWIDKIGEYHHTDVLLPNCWTTDIVRVDKGFNPKLIITGHENEMGHSIDHREPYWLTYQRKMGSDRFGGSSDVGYSRPLILMTWGESYLYQRSNFKKGIEP